VAGTRIPGVLPVLYAVMDRSVRARQRVGTVAVTAVGMFAGGGGFDLAPPTLMSLRSSSAGSPNARASSTARSLSARCSTCP
jgi:hypothetical protein